MPEHSPTYYTDDVTLMPTSVIWRMAGGGSTLSGIVAFAYLALRKLFRCRFPASYAAARPSELPKVAPDSVPEAVLDALQPFIDDCLRANFHVVTWTRPKIIGRKRLFTVILLDSPGRVSAMARLVPRWRRSTGPNTADFLLPLIHKRRRSTHDRAGRRRELDTVPDSSGKRRRSLASKYGGKRSDQGPCDSNRRTTGPEDV